MSRVHIIKRGGNGVVFLNGFLNTNKINDFLIDIAFNNKKLMRKIEEGERRGRKEG